MRDVPLLQRVPTGQSCVQQDCGTGRCSTGEMFSVGDARTMIWLQTSSEFGLCCCPETGRPTVHCLPSILRLLLSPQKVELYSSTLFLPHGRPTLSSAKVKSGSSKQEAAANSRAAQLSQEAASNQAALVTWPLLPQLDLPTPCASWSSALPLPLGTRLLATQMKGPFPAVA